MYWKLHTVILRPIRLKYNEVLCQCITYHGIRPIIRLLAKLIVEKELIVVFLYSSEGVMFFIFKEDFPASETTDIEDVMTFSNYVKSAHSTNRGNLIR